MADVPCTYVASPDIDRTLGSTSIDLISSSVSGTVIDQSDHWFAEASNLINPKPPISGNGRVVYTGGWYDGWETRRHNKKEFDYAIIKLGPEINQNGGGFVHGVEIDTAFFNGNEAPAISVEGFAAPRALSAEELKATDDEVISWKDGKGQWETILSKQACGPNRRQAWILKAPTPCPYTHVRLNMYPDGGIARFRLYGRPATPTVSDNEPTNSIDLAAAVNGGRCVSCSDEHFSKTSNLLLPGRGIDMSDGWETRRSREPGHTDWVIVRLATPGRVENVTVDTAHFRGNFPDKCQVLGIDWQGKDGEPRRDDPGWVDLSGMQACEAHTEHVFRCADRIKGSLSHVKLVIVPDGGVKRLRVIGLPTC